MVDVEIARHRDGLAGVGIDPTTGVHNATAGVAEEDRNQALFDQHFRSRVLTITIDVVSELPVITVVGT